jgi:D-alanine-D-alanine ligase
MKPLAVIRTDRPVGRAAAPGFDHGRIRSCDRRLRGGDCGPASQAFGGSDAKDAEAGPDHDRPANLKPNIYYEVQDFTLGIHRIPGRRGASPADCDLSGTAGKDSEPLGPAFNARPGSTETSAAPDIAARASFSFEEPAGRMVEDAACDC